jgi:SAM-dependent methyltransferase
MGPVTTVFGEVAGEYEGMRPGYPASIAAAISGYLGRQPVTVAEVGAGTGKGTEVFALLGGRLICVEPDPRMAEHLTAKLPDAEVVISDFDGWSPPSSGVCVLAAAMVWHLLDADRRCSVARRALAPAGVLALVGRGYVNADAAKGAVLDAVLGGFGLSATSRSPAWIHDEVTASGLFSDVTLTDHDSDLTLSGPDYLRLVTTFSSFRRLEPDRQSALQAALDGAIASTGGSVPLRLRTTLTLARPDRAAPVGQVR